MTPASWTRPQLAELEADIERQIDAAVETVKAAPLLAPEVALQDLYAEG